MPPGAASSNVDLETSDRLVAATESRPLGLGRPGLTGLGENRSYLAKRSLADLHHLCIRRKGALGMESPPQRNGIWPLAGCDIRVALWLLATLLVSCLALSCRNPFPDQPIPLRSVSHLEQETTLRLPSTAVLEGGEIYRALDAIVYAKIRMPAGEVQTFLGRNGLGEASSGERDLDDGSFPGHFGWQPDKARRFLSSTADLRRPSPRSSWRVSVLVDLDRPDMAVVYIRGDEY